MNIHKNVLKQIESDCDKQKLHKLNAKFPYTIFILARLFLLLALLYVALYCIAYNMK